MENSRVAFLTNYLRQITALVDSLNERALDEIIEACLACRQRGSKCILVGNGAANSIASHFSLDFGKQAKWDAISFTDPALITAYVNDFGAEYAMARYVERYGLHGDILFAVSASGASKNILEAVKTAKSKNMLVVGLSGFGPAAKLHELSDYSINVESRAYNIIEGIHALAMGLICDGIIGASEYAVS